MNKSFDFFHVEDEMKCRENCTSKKAIYGRAHCRWGRGGVEMQLCKKPEDEDGGGANM